MEKIGFEFDISLFDEEAQKNTSARINRMMEEFREWREWDEIEKGKGIFICEDGGIYNDLVIIKKIEFTSFCQHHLLPFYGGTSIAYLPKGYLIGLSKIPRTVRKFASRPQLQEQMTHDIANYLYKWIPQVQGVMVITEAEHMCMQIRGARMTGITITSALRGEFLSNESLRNEAIRLLEKP